MYYFLIFIFNIIVSAGSIFGMELPLVAPNKKDSLWYATLQAKDGIFKVNEEQFSQTFLKDCYNADNNYVHNHRINIPVLCTVNDLNLFFNPPANMSALSFEQKKSLFTTFPYLAHRKNNTLDMKKLAEDLLHEAGVLHFALEKETRERIDELITCIEEEDIKIEKSISAGTLKGYISSLRINSLFGLFHTLEKKPDYHGLSSLTLRGLKKLSINRANNPITELLKLSYITSLEISHNTIEVIPAGTFIAPKEAFRLFWIKNNTQHIEKDAFASWNKGYVVLQDNPLTQESKDIVLADTQRTTPQELWINLRAQLLKTRIVPVIGRLNPLMPFIYDNSAWYQQPYTKPTVIF